MGRVWTVSNLFSVLRVLLVVPVSLLLLSDSRDARLTAAALIVLAALTDFLDGFFARRFREVSDLGKVLDPVADKVGIGVVALLLVLRGLIPAWFVAGILIRDVLILAGGLYLKRRLDIIPQSNRTGKWTAAVVALTVFSSLIDGSFISRAMPWLLAVSSLLLVVSFVHYALIFTAALRGNTRT